MLKSHSIILANRLQLAVHLLAFVFVTASLFIYSTVSAADDKEQRPSIEKRVEHLTEKLNLTEQQQKEITAILKASRDEMATHRNPDATKEERKEMRKSLQALRDSTESKITQVLTAEQRTQYEKMREEEKAEMKDKIKDRLQERRRDR